MTVGERRSSTDDKVEAKRRIIRRSLDEITAEVETELRHAHLRSAVSLVVPSRYSLVTIGSQLGSEEWSRTSEIVRQVVGKWLGGNELRGRPLSRSVVTAMMDADDPTRE